MVTDIHTILYWIDKNNPRGGKPTNPGDDPQFMHWEYPIQKWKQGLGIIEGDRSWIPTEFDSTHTSNSVPGVIITSPANNSSTSVNTPLTVSVQATGTYTLTKAEFYFNGILVGSSTRAPFSLTTTPGEHGIQAGEGIISVVVTDGVYNKGEARTQVIFTE